GRHPHGRPGFPAVVWSRCHRGTRGVGGTWRGAHFRLEIADFRVLPDRCGHLVRSRIRDGSGGPPIPPERPARLTSGYDFDTSPTTTGRSRRDGRILRLPAPDEPAPQPGALDRRRG